MKISNRQHITRNGILKRNPIVHFKVGDRVRLKTNALSMHSKTVPSHAGYTREQFLWREHLDKLGDRIGRIQRVFPNSTHINVDFDGELIGIDTYMIEKV